jgi:hypothetical protein
MTERKRAVLVVTALVLATAGTISAAMAGDIPQSPPKTTVPHTGGYVWESGPPAAPNNRPPNQGMSVGGQYPPDRATVVHCHRDGVEVPCN